MPSTKLFMIDLVVACAVAALLFSLSQNALEAVIIGCGAMVGLLFYQMWLSPSKPKVGIAKRKPTHEG